MGMFTELLGPLPTSPKLSRESLEMYAKFYRTSPALQLLLAKADRKPEICDIMAVTREIARG